MLTCKETSELISAQYDRHLGRWERVSMQLHLMMCRYCRVVARQIALIQKLVGAQGATDLASAGSTCLSAEARDRIRATIGKADSPKDPGITPS